MMQITPLLGLAQVYFILFAVSALAALQNVTIDDAVLTGTVVPQYLPSASSWNQGNNCSRCLAKPDPSKAYNGTWHDATFKPNNGASKTVEFTFRGSALYIFFILANTVINATTLTDVSFNLDGIAVGTFVHSPSTSTDYQYDVLVYVNESLDLTEHSMMMKPVDSGNSVLILFDYLIYTTDTDNATTPASVSPSASGPNTATIVGGTVGGVSALVLMTAFLYCYSRHRRRKGGWIHSREGEGLGSLFSLREMAPVHQMESPLSEPQPRHNMSIVTMRPPSLPVSIDPPSTASLVGNNTGLLEQIELLRGEVSRLHRLRHMNQNLVDMEHKGPPKYS